MPGRGGGFQGVFGGVDARLENEERAARLERWQGVKGEVRHCRFQS